MTAAEDIHEIGFENRRRPGLELEVVRIENLFRRTLDHPLEAPQRLHFHLIIFVTAGTGSHVIDFTRYDFGPGSLLFVAPDQVQIWQVRDDVRGFLVLFTRDFLFRHSAESELVRSLDVVHTLAGAPHVACGAEEAVELTHYVRAMEREASLGSDLIREEILRALIKIVLFHAERIHRAQPAPAAPPRAAEYLRFKRLLDAELVPSRSVSAVARELKVSPKHLNAVVKRATGKTVKALIDERVTLEAKRLLASSSLSVKEITDRLGFDEPTNFSKFFRKHAGMAPVEFRGRYRRVEVGAPG